MTGQFAGLVHEVRRLADAELGSRDWARQLLQTVAVAADDDLGTLVVSRAVLIKAAHDQAAEKARQQAEDEERRRAEANAADQRRADAVQNRRRERLRRLRVHLAPRLITSLIYVAAVAQLTSLTRRVGLVPAAMPILGVCLIAVTASLTFDWFAYSGTVPLPSRDPSGRLRAICVTTGVMVGLMPWLKMLSEQGQRSLGTISWGAPFQLGPFTTSWVAAALPVLLSVGWIAGGLTVLGVGTRTDPSVAAGISRAQQYLRPFTWLGVVSAGSTVLLYSVPQLVGWLARTIGEPSLVPQWNPWELWSNPSLIVVLGMLALLLHDAASLLSGRAAWLGWLAVVAGPLLGILSLVTSPAHLVTWLLDWTIRSLT